MQAEATAPGRLAKLTNQRTTLKRMVKRMNYASSGHRANGWVSSLAASGILAAFRAVTFYDYAPRASPLT